MRIIGLATPGGPETVDVTVGHGDDPRWLLWRRGWVVTGFLSARRDDSGEIVITTHVGPRSAASHPPRFRSKGPVRHLVVSQDEVPATRQRLAAYAIVRSPRGLLGTMCSTRTAVPGSWQLPGGGLEVGETPSAAVIREVNEETGQQMRIGRLIDVQSDHWIGRAPSGVLEDFHALRIIYSATCPEPTTPTVLDVGGTTAVARWVPLRRWRSLPWTAGARSLLDRHLDDVRPSW